MPRKNIDEQLADKETHESYGLLSISRITGRNMPLFGSNIRHDCAVRLSISKGAVSRDYQRNWYHVEKEIVEVDMSTAQFAEAITSMNIGQGVPVTLKRVDRKMIAEPPDPNFKQKAKSELKKEMGILAENIDKLSKDAKEILTSKGTIKKADKEKLLKDLMFLAQEVRSNIPFAHVCFQEAVEETVVQAKAEVDATLMAMRNEIGDRALKSGIEIPMLDEGVTQEDYEFCPKCKGRFSSFDKPIDGKCPFCNHVLDVD